MKNSFKTIPVIAGMILAFLGSVDEVKATASNSGNESSLLGYCAISNSEICGYDPFGSLVYGRWVEGG